MKLKIETITHVKMNLDSSELIMFNKGGMHKIELPGNFFDNMGGYNDDKYDEDDTFISGNSSKIIISVQLDPSKKGMFDHCTDYKYDQLKPDEVIPL